MNATAVYILDCIMKPLQCIDVFSGQGMNGLLAKKKKAQVLWIAKLSRIYIFFLIMSNLFLFVKTIEKVLRIFFEW